MTDYLKSKWEKASGRIKIALLLLLGILGLSVVFALASGALDSDSDGISDSYEQFFGMDYTNASDALLNYDADILLNIQESEAGVDPFRKDTDVDAWADGIDRTISRAFIAFEPRFIYGDHYLYPMPAYVKAVYKTGGFFTNGAWHVEENVKESKGRKGDNEQGKGHKFPISNFEFPVSSLVIELDRSLLTNNLLLEVELTKHRASGLFIDLVNTQGVVVARNLCGNLSGGNGERDRLLIELPLADYPQAQKIVLRRDKGEVTVFEILAYIDRDFDALDSDQETQIGSSDTPVSDWDEDDDEDDGDDDDGDGDKEGAEDRPKIVLDLVFAWPDPFSPALGALRLFGEYRILPTDALWAVARHIRDQKDDDDDEQFEFYVRQTIAVFDASSNVAWSAVSDFSISPSNIWFPGHYAHVGTETTYDGKDVFGALLPDGAYRYRITGTYLRFGVRRLDAAFGRQSKTSPGKSGSSTAALHKVKEKIIAVSSTLQGTVLLDATPPITEATVTPMPNAHGWHKDDVTVQLTAHDNLSGIATVYYSINGGAIERGASVTLAEQGIHTLSFWSVDNAGNVESTNSITIRIDKTAPEIAVAGRLPSVNNWGWNNSPVTVTYAVSDILSGVDVAVGGYEPDTVSGEGADQSVSGSVMDLAGNSASITLADINIDLTPPEITSAVTGLQGSNGWWVSEVTVSYEVSDALSGIDPLLGNHTADILGEGTNQAAQGDVYDKAGNHASTQVTGISVDLTSPAITASIVPEPNAAGWHNEDVTVQLTATDNLSGVAATYFSINGETTKSGASVTLAEEGVHTITYWSVDMAGNVEPAKSITIRIDKTAPEISVASRLPAANGYGWNNAPVTVTYSVSDALSGVDAALGGYEPDTMSAEGANQSVSGSVADLAGNTSSVTLDNINIDFTPPEILSFLPEDNEVVANPLQPIAIMFHENLSGIDAGGLALTLDGSDVTSEAILTATSIAYQVLQEFQEGCYTVTVSFADKADNAVQDRIAFEVDSDGLLNTWELLHFGTLDPRPEEDADSDGLSNVAEFQADIDPTDPDTDNDGFRDSADVAPISRAVFAWGEPRFVVGEWFFGFFPEWVKHAWKEGGEWETWYVSATNVDGYGGLFIELDRSIITNDAIMEIEFFDHTNSVLYVDLLTTNLEPVLTNLYGNIMDGGTTIVRKVYDVPLGVYSNAGVIHLRRQTGEVTIYETLIYVDQDRDGLDLLQEQALETSDLNADSDADGLGDFAEITIHGTSPANSDTDGDGIHDGTELQFGNDPASSNTYSVLPFVELFETNTVVVGELDGQNNWTAAPPNTAYVQTNTVYEGAQALEIAAPTDQWCEVRQILASSVTNVVWIDLYVLAIPSTAPTDRVDRSAEMYFNEQGWLVVYDGKQQLGSEWVTLTNHTPVVTGTWVRLSMKMDYSLQEWLVCLNDYVVADGLGFAVQRNEFVAMGIEAQEAFADNIAVSTNVPEGISADWDTLPDAWELAYFGNLDQTEGADPDTDGLSNLEEFQRKTNPTNDDTDGDGLKDGDEVNVHATNPTHPDSDNDRFPDGWEVQQGLNPTDPLDIGADADSDGMPDWWEKLYIGATNAAPDSDFDGDGINNQQEYSGGTDPASSDTDRDGFSDGFEPGYGVSRAFIEWGHPDFTIGDDYIYTGPAWLLRAYKDGGEWVSGVLAPTVPLPQAQGISTTNPIPWPDIDWDNPDFILGDEHVYIGTDWLVRVYTENGERVVQGIHAPLNHLQVKELTRSNPLLFPVISNLLGTNSKVPSGFNPSEWHVGSEGAGSLNIELNRTILTNDMRIEIKFLDSAGATLYMDLLDSNYTPVIADLYGNIISDTDRIVTKRFDIPLSTNPRASVIVLRKGVGEISIGETLLYLDQDRDGLDAGQEALLRTSDTAIDSDGDGLNDKAEVDAGTDPVDPASFLAGLCGVVGYAGQETGHVFIVVNDSTNLWPAERFATVSGPDAYCISNFPTLTNYWIHTFLDWNRNGAYDSWEPAGSYSLNPLHLTGNTVGIDITLYDPPDTDTDGLPDPWELYWFGTTTGAVASADEDPDGLDNFAEYRSNENPWGPVRLDYISQWNKIRAKLTTLAEQLSAEWHAKRKEAEEKAAELGLPVRQEYPDGTIAELQSFEDDMPFYHITINLNAARSISTDKVWPTGANDLNLTGSSITLGMWDGGAVRTTHQEFTTIRVTQMDSPASLSDHSTAVAGTMIAAGVVATAKGMASHASLHAYDYNNNFAELHNAAAVHNIRVSNHSYGMGPRGWAWNLLLGWVWYGAPLKSWVEDYRFGLYDDLARSTDQFVYESLYHLPVFGAGNERSEGPTNQPIWHHIILSGTRSIWTNFVHQLDGGANGYDSISHYQVTKNGLTVGAVYDIVAGYKTTSDVVMTTFSCFGPTDDGRVKPDLVANGVDIYTTSSESDVLYFTDSGTSLSAPTVSGSIGLLQELHEDLHGTNTHILASTLKALVIHTADEAGDAPGPDYRFGWGLMNTLKAAQVMTNNAAWGYFKPHIKEARILDRDYIEFRVNADPNQPLRVTICWTDPPGTLQPSQLDPANIVLVNDIDLRVIDPNGTTNMPWILNSTNPSAPATTGDNIRDNVEQVHITNPVAGLHTIRVTHKGSLSNGMQNVSIIVTGNIPTNAPEFKITNFSLTSEKYHQMEWSSVVGNVYRISTCTNLLQTGGWTNKYTNDIRCTKETTSWTDPTADPIRFYRIKAIQ